MWLFNGFPEVASTEPRLHLFVATPTSAKLPDHSQEFLTFQIPSKQMPGNPQRWKFSNTRCAPTSYKWSYKPDNPYKWPYKWITGVTVFTLLFHPTSRDPVTPFYSWWPAHLVPFTMLTLLGKSGLLQPTLSLSSAQRQASHRYCHSRVPPPPAVSSIHSWLR